MYLHCFFKHLAISNHQSFCKKINSFPCFFRPLFHSTVLKPKSYMLCSKMRFRTGSKMRPLGRHFRQKGSQRCSPPVGGRPLLADLGATSGPKRPRLRFHRFRGRFWSDFGLDFKAIWARFRNNLSYHL